MATQRVLERRRPKGKVGRVSSIELTGSFRASRLIQIVCRLMSRRFVACLLFGLALLTQLASPLSRGGAMAGRGASGLGLSASDCLLLHVGRAGVSGDESAASGAERPAPPSGGSCHDHGCCPLCQIGAGDVPAPATLEAQWAAHPDAARAVYYVDGARTVSPPLNRSAPARAPPSRV